MSYIFDKIQRVVMRLRFRPIRIFVFHHVSDVYDSLMCGDDDWTQTEQFKRNILSLQSRYQFISLSEACERLQHDTFRMKNYAVLTTDDGLASALNILPWLEEQKIPLTMFVNTRLMERDMLKPISVQRLMKLAPDADVKAIAEGTYLSKDQIFSLTSPLLAIGLHGHEHLNARQIQENIFEHDCEKEKTILQSHPRYISAYAYPWGLSTESSIKYLRAQGIIPVVVDTAKNYKWNGIISRECIDNTKI